MSNSKMINRISIEEQAKIILEGLDKYIQVDWIYEGVLPKRYH